MLTFVDEGDIIDKHSRWGHNESEKVTKNFEKSFKKPLDKRERMWYNIKAFEKKVASFERTKMVWKNFEKSLKNLLTNSKRCDIITKSSERSERQS